MEKSEYEGKKRYVLMKRSANGLVSAFGEVMARNAPEAYEKAKDEVSSRRHQLRSDDEIIVQSDKGDLTTFSLSDLH